MFEKKFWMTCSECGYNKEMTELGDELICSLCGSKMMLHFNPGKKLETSDKDCIGDNFPNIGNSIAEITEIEEFNKQKLPKINKRDIEDLLLDLELFSRQEGGKHGSQK